MFMPTFRQDQQSFSMLIVSRIDAIFATLEDSSNEFVTQTDLFKRNCA